MLTIATIRFPRYKGTKHTITVILTEDLVLEQWIVPKNTEVQTFQSENFGYVILPKDCQDKRGFTIPRVIFRY